MAGLAASFGSGAMTNAIEEIEFADVMPSYAVQVASSMLSGPDRPTAIFAMNSHIVLLLFLPLGSSTFERTAHSRFYSFSRQSLEGGTV